jgi:urocanate hydratase
MCVCLHMHMARFIFVLHYRALMVSDPPAFRAAVASSLVRHVNAVRSLSDRGMAFWDYGNAFLLEGMRAGADVLTEASAGRQPENGGEFRWQTYFQAFMGDIFGLGFGPFR